MPERLHDRPRIDPLGQQERGGRVPQVVEADVGQLGGLEDPFEAMHARGLTDGLPVVPPTEDAVRRLVAALRNWLMRYE